MTAESLKPAMEFPLKTGQIREYCGVRLRRGRRGSLWAGDITGTGLVCFHCRRGMSSLRCFAALKDGIVYIFEGDAVGRGMIDDKQVRQTLGL